MGCGASVPQDGGAPAHVAKPLQDESESQVQFGGASARGFTASRELLAAPITRAQPPDAFDSVHVAPKGAQGFPAPQEQLQPSAPSAPPPDRPFHKQTAVSASPSPPQPPLAERAPEILKAASSIGDHADDKPAPATNIPYSRDSLVEIPAAIVTAPKTPLQQHNSNAEFSNIPEPADNDSESDGPPPPRIANAFALSDKEETGMMPMLQSFLRKKKRDDVVVVRSPQQPQQSQGENPGNAGAGGLVIGRLDSVDSLDDAFEATVVENVAPAAAVSKIGGTHATFSVDGASRVQWKPADATIPTLSDSSAHPFGLLD
ncbi:hypothetical protein HDU83_003160 [Entophlyctis luteolus]|nr:hypothetical protein HDU82_006030 [Entophlyctis luteolus]KAJ3346350.1 hypothetical protein HDU83_003160 [Entophlyctis luteolus]